MRGHKVQAVGNSLDGLKSSSRNNPFLSFFDVQSLPYLPFSTWYWPRHWWQATHQWLRDEQRRGRAPRVVSQAQHLGHVLCCALVSMLCALKSMVPMASTHVGLIIPHLLVVKPQLTADITHVLLEAKLSSRKPHVFLGSQHS